MVDGPITLPPVNVRPETGPTDRSDYPPGGATPGAPTEGGDHPPGDLSSAGQPNQTPTVQRINRTRQVRPVNATTLGSPSTPARADLTIATGRRTIATGHRHRSDNWRSATEARAANTVA